MSGFVELPISLIDGKLKDLGVSSKEVPAKLSVRIDSIIAVREAMNDEDELCKSIIYLSSGESFFVEKDYSYTQRLLIKR